MSWSISKKMFAMGTGIVIALALLAGMNFNSYMAVNKAMETNTLKVKELSLAQEMKAAQLELALAAVESISEKAQGKIPAARMKRIKTASAYLLSNVKNLKQAADTGNKKASMEKITKDLESLDKIIRKDLVTLIGDSAVKVSQINRDFEKIHETLKGYSVKIEEDLASLGAALQFKITMADSEEIAAKGREGSELVNYLSKAVSSLLLVAIESIIEKDQGKLTDKQLTTIKRNVDFLNKRLPNLSNYAEESSEKESVQKIERNAKALTASIEKKLPALLAQSLKEMVQMEGTFTKLNTTLKEYVGDVALHLNRVADWSTQGAEDANQQLRKTQAVSFRNGIILLLVIVTVMVMVFYLFARSITKPINNVIKDLNLSSDQLTSSSGQVSTASQTLAEGSSEQAASIEETSASLEEMSAMTQKNADNANHADGLMKEADQVVGNAHKSMAQLTTSMEEISVASEETSKIIKTIDEISFQTNLLALNAAVEAARAGEAGAGFAVVADEVRNLAIRAADAAKNTSVLIEGTMKKVTDGSGFVTRSNEAFSEVATSVVKVKELVAEIAAASSEQAQGIEQVNRAVVEMDKVVQQNAANTEETASASQEMTSQAEQMKTIVGELVALVGGKAKGSTGMVDGSARISATKPRDWPQDRPAKKLTSAAEVSPKELIPLDEGDFRDF